MQTLRKGSKGVLVSQLQRSINLMPDGIFGDLTEEGVKQFQSANGLKPDGVVGPLTWEKIQAMTSTVISKSKRDIKEIIIHCSDTPEGRDVSVADIRRYHLTIGFSDIGYHYIIYRDGSIHNGRDIDVSGAHCLNHNSRSIGICYIGGQAAKGGQPKDTRTDAQKKALLSLLKELKRLYPGATIHGHNEFAAKACPCFNVKNEYSNL